MKNGSDIGAVFVSCAHNFQAEDSQARPRPFFVFRVGLLLSNRSEMLIIRSSEAQVSAPIIQLHLRVDTDTLD